MQQPSCTSCSNLFHADGKSAAGAATEGSEAPDRPLNTQPLDKPQALQQVQPAGVAPPEAATAGGQQHQAAATADWPRQAATSTVGQQQQAGPGGNMPAGTSDVQQPVAAKGYVRQQAASWNKVYANAAWQSPQVPTAGCHALQKLQAPLLAALHAKPQQQLILPRHGCTWPQGQEQGQPAAAPQAEGTAVPVQQLDTELRPWGSLHNNAVWQPSVEQTPGLAGAGAELRGGTSGADDGDSQSDVPSLPAPAGRACLHGRRPSRQACSSQAQCSAAASDVLLPGSPAGPGARAALHYLPVHMYLAALSAAGFLQVMQHFCAQCSPPSQSAAAGPQAQLQTVRVPS